MTPTRRIRLAAFALAAAAGAYGMFLVVVGLPVDTFAESASGGVFVDRVFEPMLAGVWPAIGGAAVLVGLLFDREPIAWLGWLALAAFAILSVFGAGGFLVPIDVALLVALLREYRPNGLGRTS